MKAIKYIVLALFVFSLFSFLGCEKAEDMKKVTASAEEKKIENQTQAESQDNGIDDVFQNTEEVNPPSLP
jgi:hypothetical protein